MGDDDLKITADDIKNVCTSVIKRSNDELFKKSREQLDDYWHFMIRPEVGDDWNLYRFHKALALYSSFVRRWEEHHNGNCCVVERIRDRYLLPKIREFIESQSAEIAGE